MIIKKAWRKVAMTCLLKKEWGRSLTNTEIKIRKTMKKSMKIVRLMDFRGSKTHTEWQSIIGHNSHWATKTSSIRTLTIPSKTYRFTVRISCHSWPSHPVKIPWTPTKVTNPNTKTAWTFWLSNAVPVASRAIIRKAGMTTRRSSRKRRRCRLRYRSLKPCRKYVQIGMGMR